MFETYNFNAYVADSVACWREGGTSAVLSNYDLMFQGLFHHAIWMPDEGRVTNPDVTPAFILWNLFRSKVSDLFPGWSITKGPERLKDAKLPQKFEDFPRSTLFFVSNNENPRNFYVGYMTYYEDGNGACSPLSMLHLVQFVNNAKKKGLFSGYEDALKVDAVIDDGWLAWYSIDKPDKKRAVEVPAQYLAHFRNATYASPLVMSFELD